MNNKAIFTKGPVRKQLFTMTLSMLIGMLGMSLFNLTDTFFIGKIGSRELAAMNFTMPVVFMVASIALGLGVGASSVISRAIGEGNKEKVQRLTSDALLLSLLIKLKSGKISSCLPTSINDDVSIMLQSSIFILNSL
jgi:Na+-driven multidrug efflux pump